MIFNPIIGGKKLPVLDNPGSANDLLEGKQLIDQDGNSLTGTIPIKTSSDVSVNGANIIIPSGYYNNQVNTSVESVEQATPTISVSSSGLITASSTQSEGYVSAGTKSSTKQLSTQAGTTITPGTTQKVAVASGKYTTGAVNVAGDANLVASNIKSGVNIFGVNGTLIGLISSLYTESIYPITVQILTIGYINILCNSFGSVDISQRLSDILGFYISAIHTNGTKKFVFAYVPGCSKLVEFSYNYYYSLWESQEYTRNQCSLGTNVYYPNQMQIQSYGLSSILSTGDYNVQEYSLNLNHPNLNYP